MYETRGQHCIGSILKKNRNAVAASVSYPLRVNGSPPFSMTTRQALLKRWNRIFAPFVMQALRDAVRHEMFMHDEATMIGNDDAEFDGDGMTAIDQTKTRKKTLTPCSNRIDGRRRVAASASAAVRSSDALPRRSLDAATSTTELVVSIADTLFSTGRNPDTDLWPHHHAAKRSATRRRMTTAFPANARIPNF